MFWSKICIFHLEIKQKWLRQHQTKVWLTHAKVCANMMKSALSWKTVIFENKVESKSTALYTSSLWEKRANDDMWRNIWSAAACLWANERATHGWSNTCNRFRQSWKVTTIKSWNERLPICYGIYSTRNSVHEVWFNLIILVPNWFQRERAGRTAAYRFVGLFLGESCRRCFCEVCAW